MTNVLFEQFPDCVEVDGKFYEIVTDFREWIKFLTLVEDEDVPWRIKAELLLGWFVDKVPLNLEGAIHALGDFLLAKNLYQKEGEEQDNSTREPAFSYEEDAGCIYAAFREAYGINLQTVDYMHWWEFKTLFDWLPEKTEIKQRMLYRTIDLNDIKDKEERKRVKKIKEMIKLKSKECFVSEYDIGDFLA